MLRILAPIAALGLIASPALATTKTTAHKTHRMGKKPMAKKMTTATDTSTTTGK